MSATFEQQIKEYLEEQYNEHSQALLQNSPLLQYIVLKTKSANKGSKSRGSFANLYAIYVIVEDYINNGFTQNDGYKQYEGAQFSALFSRQRELPFGAKLQNHALNSRMNEEFIKFFPLTKSMPPIMRDLRTKRYWINENYLKIKVGIKTYNIATDISKLIDLYISKEQSALKGFIEQCTRLQEIEENKDTNIREFIIGLLAPNVDARLFEIASYSILKYYYKDIKIYWGYSISELIEENLSLYKTGRTNANDGGIDFVMRPLGRFFQVTETLDFKKYFLDIEKLERFPLSFVIKTELDEEEIRTKLKEDASNTYIIENIVEKYMNCIEEIINIPILKEYYDQLEKKQRVQDILNEIILQSKIEFNYDEDEE